MLVAPSLLAADFLNLGNDVRKICGSADLIHLDVMDGSFVPNISFGFPVIEAVSSIASIPTDAHLMTVHPERWFKRLSECGTSMVSFHLEAAGENTGAYLDEIRSLGMKAGVAINPDVPVESIFPYIGRADFFLVMSVFAGFGGQKFIPESTERVARLEEELVRKGDSAAIEVDGGVNAQNAKLLMEAGAGILVAGSSVFKSDNPDEMIKTLK